MVWLLKTVQQIAGQSCAGVQKHMTQTTNCLYTKPETNDQSINPSIISACKEAAISNLSKYMTHSFLAFP